MSSAKVDKETVNLATAAAFDALKIEKGIAWIKQSALFERAYYWGIIMALRAVSEKDDLEQAHLALLETAFSRYADDSFLSTGLGQDYAALKECFDSIDLNENGPATIDILVDHINSLDQNWRSAVKHAVNELSEIQSQYATVGPLTEKTSYLNRNKVLNLNDVVRYLALLETHHEMTKRLRE
jgi:hypothetical protein